MCLVFFLFHHRQHQHRCTMPPKLKKRDSLGNQLTDSNYEMDTDAAVEAELKRISLIVARRNSMMTFSEQMRTADGPTPAPPYNQLRPYENGTNSLTDISHNGGMSNFLQPVSGLNFQSHHHHHHGQVNFAGSHLNDNHAYAKGRRTSLPTYGSTQTDSRMDAYQHTHTNPVSFGTAQVDTGNLSYGKLDKYEQPNVYRLTQEQPMWGDEKAASLDTSQVGTFEVANGITGKRSQPYLCQSTQDQYDLSDEECDSICSGDWSNKQNAQSNLKTDITPSNNNDVDGNHTADQERAIGYADVDGDEIIAWYKSLDD